MTKYAIILRAFGSTEPAHRQVRDKVFAAYHRAFPDAAIRFVLSSRQVRQAEGLPDFDATIEALADLGVEYVIVQHLLLVPGQMYAEAMELPRGLACQVGAPLLCSDADADWFAGELVQRITPEVPTVFAVHGNTRNPQHNRVHMNLWERCEGLFNGREIATLASLEGEPGVKPLYALKEQALHHGQAHIVPLFLFPGGHVLDDLLGDQEDSWRKQLEVPVSYSPTLLEQEWVVDRFIANTKDALSR